MTVQGLPGFDIATKAVTALLLLRTGLAMVIAWYWVRSKK